LVTSDPPSYLPLISSNYYTQDIHASYDIGKMFNPPDGALSDYIADFGGTGAWLEWEVNAPKCTKYMLTIRYLAGDPRPVNLYVDGVLQAGGIATIGNNWLEFKTVQKEVDLGCTSSDSHILRFQADESYGPNIDILIVSYGVKSPTKQQSFSPSKKSSSAPSLVTSDPPSYLPTKVTSGPTVETQPTISPLAPSYAPTGACEKPEYKFFYRMKKNGKPRRQKCDWLAKKKKSIRKKICERNVDYFEVRGVIFGPAQTVCKDSCKSCDPCYENEKSKYVFYKKGQEIKKTCRNVSSLPPTTREKFCGQEHFNSAKNICPVSCEVGHC